MCTGLNQPIHSLHVTQAGRNRVRFLPVDCRHLLLQQKSTLELVSISLFSCWLELSPTEIWVRFIYTFSSSLSFNSPILEWILLLSQHFEILLKYLFCHFPMLSNYFWKLSQARGIFCLYLFWDKEKWQLNW